MLFTTTILTSLLAAVASASVLPARQPPPVWESPFTGAIDAPVENQAMAFGVEFPFSYTVSDWCEPAFAPFTVYLTTGAAPPTFANVTSTGALADGIGAFEFGKFVVSRFGLPQQGPPPPATLTMPTVDELVVGLSADTNMFLTVVEEFDGCPGHITVEYGLTSVPLTFPAITA